MAWSESKAMVVAAVAMLLAAAATIIAVFEYQEYRKYSWETPRADFGAFYKAPAQVGIIHTKFANDGGFASDGGRGAVGIGLPLKAIVEVAYQTDDFHTLFETTLPTNRYDFISKLVPPQQPHKVTPVNPDWTKALQDEIKGKFGVVGSWETRNRDVLLLRPVAAGTRGFTISHSMPNGLAVKPEPGNYSFYEQPVNTLISQLQLQRRFQILVVDETGLTEVYDYSLKWNEPNPKLPNNEGLKHALRDQLGLELVPTNMPVKMLVMKKAQ